MLNSPSILEVANYFLSAHVFYKKNVFTRNIEAHAKNWFSD